MVPGAVFTTFFCHLQMGPISKSVTSDIAESPANNKHSSLLVHFVRYGKKSFVNMVPGAVFTALFYL
jgi:hypothetical protein